MISVHRNRPWGPRLKPFTTASALALLLAGCAVGPEYQTPDIELPESWPAHITLEQQARDDWHRWWQRFEDPALNRLVERASEDNLELAIQLARIREARAQLGFADAERFPTVGYQAEANRERTPGAALPIDVQPGV